MLKSIQIKFSEEELIHLLHAWAAITLAFAILMSRGNYSFLSQNLLISALTVGIAFLFHEIAHKILAQKYGCWAEFRKFDLGLILAILMSFFGFLFAAPGAVFIFGLISEKEEGKISLAGPMANIFLAFIFLIFTIFFKNFIFKISLFGLILSQGFYINSWLAFFNLLPFPPFDGSKIIRWSVPLWIISIFIASIFVFIV